MLVVLVAAFIILAIWGVVYQANEDFNSEQEEKWMYSDELHSLKHFLKRTGTRCIFAVGAGLVYGIIDKYIPVLRVCFVVTIIITTLGMISTEIGAIQKRSEALTYLSIATAVSVPNILSILFIAQFLLVVWIWKVPNEYDTRYRTKCVVFLFAALLNIFFSVLGVPQWVNFLVLITQACILPLIVAFVVFLANIFTGK